MNQKILISWIATNHDFLKHNKQGELLKTESKFNEDGPHFSLYQDFPDFDVHYLLSQYPENHPSSIKWLYLADALRKKNKKVELRFMDIDDVFSVGTIKGKLDTLLYDELSGNQIEVFMNPGTPSMQIAWYLIGTEQSNKLDIKFFRRRERRFIKTGTIPEKEYVDFDSSEYARVTNIRDSKKIDNISEVEPLITVSLENAYTRALQVAGNDRTTVLISGETGTGKEELARYIHEKSNRKNKPYITINCAAFHGDLLESRLFGYEKGAFSGAIETTQGAFEDAQGGTILLDEIGDISQRMQITLLRVLQEKEISKIGSTKKVPLDIRIITSTNKDLWQISKDGDFRNDLYHRLAIAEIELPAFREFSKKERKIWVQYFLESLYTFLDKRYLSKVDKQVWDFLLTYPFYGNIRELKNTIETFYTFCEKQITYNDIPKRMLRETEVNSFKLDNVIKNHIKNVVDFCDGNHAEAGRLLEKNRATVRKYLLLNI